ncbi:MAG: hypothetical protein R3B47_07120 [Bacteroidia bacterium]
MLNFFSEQNIEFFSFKDQVIFEKEEILLENAAAYSVFTLLTNLADNLTKGAFG